MNGRPSQRFDEWQQRLRSICGSFEIRPGAASPAFVGYAGRLDFGGLEVARIQSNVASLARGRRLAAREGDHCFLILQIEGHQHVVVDGVESIELRAGEMALVDSSLPFEMVVHGCVDNLSVHLPRRLLAQRLQRQHMAGKLSAERASTQLMQALMSRLRDIDPQYRASIEEGDAFRAALLDLLPATLPAPALSAGTRQGEDLYRAACALIDAQLPHAYLEPGWIAAQLSISRRRLYRLFADHGELGVARFILDRRLDRAAQLLRDDARHAPISELAQAVGIADQGHFSRAFRRRFAMSPSRYRSA